MSLVPQVSGEAVGKAAGNVYARLFDHKPAIQGEVHYFVREFETKRGNRDLDRLKQSSDRMQEVQETYMPECTTLCKEYLTAMHQKVAEVSSYMEDAMKVEEKAEEMRVQRRFRQKTDFDSVTEDVDTKLNEERHQIDLEFERAIIKFKKSLDDKDK